MSYLDDIGVKEFTLIGLVLLGLVVSHLIMFFIYIGFSFGNLTLFIWNWTGDSNIGFGAIYSFVIIFGTVLIIASGDDINRKIRRYGND